MVQQFLNYLKLNIQLQKYLLNWLNYKIKKLVMVLLVWYVNEYLFYYFNQFIFQKVIIAAELLKNADQLVQQKIHPTSVISGYKLACK